MRKVVKFGGSSLADSKQFEKVGNIISADESRLYVVPSAPGKRFSKDTKVTDMLIKAYEITVEGGDLGEQLKKIKARYDEIIDGLGLELTLDDEFATIKENLEKDPYLDPRLYYGDGPVPVRLCHEGRAFQLRHRYKQQRQQRSARSGRMRLG